MQESPEAKQSARPFDPVFLSARREFKLTLLVWLVFALWVVTYSWINGHAPAEEEIPITLGMPSWAFWGVGLPWVVANLITFWFCFGFMRDDPLHTVEEEAIAGGDDEKGGQA